MSAQQYTPAALASLLQKLSIEDGEENNDEVLKYANNVLRKSKSDAFALRTKVTALIKLERYEDALKLLEGEEGKNISHNELEHAYCLYKTGRLEEAREVASNGAADERRRRGLRHLEAQSAYRLEKFSDAAKLYGNLTGSKAYAESEDYDLKVNLLASKAQTVFKGQGDRVPHTKTNREDLDAYETAFNAASLNIARGDYRGGLVLLKRAKDLCSAIEGLSEAEMAAELAPILVQEIYVLVKLGKTSEAAEICKSIDIRSLNDESLKPIATNNVVLTAVPDNAHLANRLFASAAPSDKSTLKPFTFQSRILHRNAATLALKVGKLHAANVLSKQHLKLFPSDYSMSTIAAAASIGAEEELSLKPKTKLKKLEAVYKANPADIGLCFTLVQAFMKEKDLTGALNVLDSLLKALEDQPEKRYLPGVVGVIVALYGLQGRKQGIKTELENASSYWREDNGSNPEILLASGISKLPSTIPGAQEEAAEIFATLMSTSPSPMANAGYVASNPREASEEHIRQMTSINQLISGIDIDNLISSGISATGSAKRSTEKQSKSKVLPPKKKRKTKLPKNYDPDKKPDPERWLPLRDRSTYKPKGKKDKKKMRDLTQGGPVASDGDVEMIGGNSVKKVAQTGGGGASKSGKKKGKGKGKK